MTTELHTRRPTGRAPWPIILLAGKEKSGKSFAAALASASPLVGRTLWVGIGEDAPDEYALVPGADFEIVEHDGTYTGILAAITAVGELDGAEPVLLVVDSMTRLWDQIVDGVQRIANQRAKGRKTSSGDYSITPDLWNTAKEWWERVMDAIRTNKGPVILTARLEQVVVMEDGQPTKDRMWKVQAHKSLPFDVAAVVEMHERGHALLSGVRSVRLQLEKPTEFPGFTVTTLWERMGLEPTQPEAAAEATEWPVAEIGGDRESHDSGSAES